MMSLHCQNPVAKKRSVALNILLAVRTVMLQEEVDMVAGDFNGATWRRRSGPDHQSDSTLEGALKNRKLQVPPSPTPLWEPGRFRADGLRYASLSTAQV